MQAANKRIQRKNRFHNLLLLRHGIPVANSAPAVHILLTSWQTQKVLLHAVQRKFAIKLPEDKDVWRYFCDHIMQADTTFLLELITAKGGPNIRDSVIENIFRLFLGRTVKQNNEQDDSYGKMDA